MVSTATKKRKNPLTSSRSSKKRKTVTLDHLQWKTVSMPDRLDDVEGFFGLEEVSDVEVDKLDSGTIEYKVENGGESTADDAGEWCGIADSDDSDVDEDGGVLLSPVSKDKIEESKERSQKLSKNEKRKNARQERKEKKVLDKAEKGKLEKEKTKPQTFNAFSSLADADSEDDDLLPEWEKLNLSLPTLRGLSKLGFAKPTPIQTASIPNIMAGHDLIGKASTGSGKTLAFGIPILESYLTLQTPDKIKRDNKPLALVLSPTRELAHQLHSHLTALSAYAPEFRVVVLTGGLSLQKQVRQLSEHGGPDVIIATPGRLHEVVAEGKGWISRLRQSLRFLVVDEADRLLQEGHFAEFEEVLALLARGEDEEDESEGDAAQMEDVEEAVVKKKAQKKKSAKRLRQTLVFSATFHKGLQQKLAGKGKKVWGKEGGLMTDKESMEYLLKKLKFREENPKFVDVNPVGQLAENLREGIIECGPMEKDLYLYYLLLRYPCKTLVFTNSVSAVKRLAPYLSLLQLPANPLHSNMIQKARLRNLERFSSPSNPNSILIATDVAARGLDIKGVQMVVQYHLPRTADTYVHRSGRTARADSRGISVLLCSPEEVSGVRRLVGKVHDTATTSKQYNMKSFDVDRKVVSRLKPRVILAQKITQTSVERQKKGSENEWLKKAAEDLGVDYDSEEFANGPRMGRGRIRGKEKKDKAAEIGKDETRDWNEQLKRLLGSKVNSGVSERYLTSGLVNLADALLGKEMHEGILGVEKRDVLDEVAW